MNIAHISVGPFELWLEVVGHFGQNAKPPKTDDASRSRKQGEYKSADSKFTMQACEVGLVMYTLQDSSMAMTDTPTKISGSQEHTTFDYLRIRNCRIHCTVSVAGVSL